MISIKYYVSIALLCFASIAFATPVTDIQKVYSDWCRTIGTAKGHGNKVVSFYAKDAVLLPTLSNALLKKPKELEGYFNQLTSRPHIKCIPKKLMTQQFGDIYINTGFYDFSYQKNKQTIILPARFTFVYKKEHEKWLIVHHHSSKLPRGY